MTWSLSAKQVVRARDFLVIKLLYPSSRAMENHDTTYHPNIIKYMVRTQKDILKFQLGISIVTWQVPLRYPDDEMT